MLQLLFSDGTIDNISLDNISDSPEVILVYSCSSFSLKNIQLTNVSVTPEALVRIHKSNNIRIEDISLTSIDKLLISVVNTNVTSILNVSLKNSKQVMKFQDSIVTEMAHCMFDNNTQNGTNRGGVLAMIDSTMVIKNTTFQNNQALVGGAISFECNSINKCDLALENCTFTNNSAKTEGGAIFYSYNRPTITETKFTNNTANYGPNFASYAARIGMVGNTPNDDLILSNVGSGVTISEPLRLAFFDFDDQILNLDNTSQIKILALDQNISSIKGINVVTVKSGIAEFDGIAPVIDLKLRQADYSVNSKTLDIFKLKNILGHSYKQKDLTVKFRDCQPGERILGNECME
jgi:hypothetical protein